MFLVARPEQKDVAAQLKRRFLPEKIFCGYTAPDAQSKALADAVLGSRGFVIKEHAGLGQAADPEAARAALRLLIGMNLGKILVFFVPAGFISLVMEALGDQRRVEKEGSITTVMFTWEKELKIASVEETGHLSEKLSEDT